MNEQVIFCVGGDLRQVYTSMSLADCGRVYTCGINGTGGKVIPLAGLEDMPEQADVLVLPLMGSDELKVKCFSGGEIAFTRLTPKLKKGALVTGGRLGAAAAGYFKAKGFDVADYFKEEALMVKNCLPTAEGTLEIAMRETAFTVAGSKVLITGFGRTARSCALLFKAVGADCTVAARSSAALAQAWSMGLGTLDIKGMKNRLFEFDIVINTVPAMILDREALEKTAKDTLIIDLASKPGGTDLEAAKELNRRTVHALALPGKAAPGTAGIIIADTVRDILRERGKRNE